MLHGFSFLKLVMLSTLIFTYWNASNSHIFNTGTYTLSVRRTPNQMIVTWIFPDRAIKGQSQKRLKDNQGWEKPVFFKKNNPRVFCFILIRIFFLRNRFCYFLKKNTKTPFWIVFICIMLCHHFKNSTITTCLPIMAFKFEGKEIYPIFVCAKGCWSIHSKLESKAWQERAQQTEKSRSHKNSAVSRQV